MPRAAAATRVSVQRRAHHQSAAQSAGRSGVPAAGNSRACPPVLHPCAAAWARQLEGGAGGLRGRPAEPHDGETGAQGCVRGARSTRARARAHRAGACHAHAAPWLTQPCWAHALLAGGSEGQVAQPGGGRARAAPPPGPAARRGAAVSARPGGGARRAWSPAPDALLRGLDPDTALVGCDARRMDHAAWSHAGPLIAACCCPCCWPFGT